MSLPALTSDELDVYARVQKAIGETEFVPKDLRSPGAFLGAVLYGRALGLEAMVALREVSVVEGTPSLSATATLGLIRAAGHSVTFEEGEEACTAMGKRTDTGDRHRATWTLEDAKRAGLLGKRNWQQYPRAMLRSRAVTELARALFSDVFSGMSVYTPEEVGAEDAEGAAALPAAEPAAPSASQEERWTPSRQPEEPPDALEREARARERNRHWALVNMLDANPVAPPPEPHGTWDEFSKALATDRYGVESRGELDSAQWRQLHDWLDAEADEGAPI